MVGYVALENSDKMDSLLYQVYFSNKIIFLKFKINSMFLISMYVIFFYVIIFYVKIFYAQKFYVIFVYASFFYVLSLSMSFPLSMFRRTVIKKHLCDTIRVYSII
jgi:hypothetical protein